MSRKQYLPSKGPGARSGRLEKFIEQSEAAGLACAACATPLKLVLGGWRLTAGTWEHKCNDHPDGNWHVAVPRRLFEIGLLRPITASELEGELCDA